VGADWDPQRGRRQVMMMTMMMMMVVVVVVMRMVMVVVVVVMMMMMMVMMIMIMMTMMMMMIILVIMMSPVVQILPPVPVAVGVFVAAKALHVTCGDRAVPPVQPAQGLRGSAPPLRGGPAQGMSKSARSVL
jgi:hypothetical protein